MATSTITVCDECGKETKRLIHIDKSHYCSRDCYLAVCKRVFDSHWFQELKSSQPDGMIRKTKPRFTRVA